jgi:hypothetical protein
MSAAAIISSIASAVASATAVGLEVYRAARGDDGAIIRAHQKLVELAKAEAARRRSKSVPRTDTGDMQ